jgi:orotidine-5'-phosphate decarboxylase
MAKRHFFELLGEQQRQGKFLCVGLDPDWDKLPKLIGREPHPTVRITDVTMKLVNETFGSAAAYKPNSAFFEDRGPDGIAALKKTIEYINRVAPEVPVILDAKRADIGNTNNGYARFAFDYLGADALTVNPYFGQEALRPFLNRTEKGIYILCRTSNPGAGELQDLPITRYSIPLYRYIAQSVAQRWNANGNCGLVVGATAPEELRLIRQDVGNMQLLIPGIGTQGGDLKKSIQNGKSSENGGFLINVSSGISGSKDPHDTAKSYDRDIRAELLAPA